ncbi:DNA replication complex GINS protein SLD5 [Artemisia annua]|uniref:DNA replication complex GINS protein SLD5 n=1 Tax=Artemisia annua TaxID=35608 RepID=A0A2U1M182_ARTAN|nr:DNA replication complex GINS protein SLD5 [Artemisia annua]
MDSGTGVFSDDYETLISTTDADLLKRSWCNEKAAPEMLQFEGSLEETVEELMQNGEDPLTVSLYQMDIDRTTFLLRSYLRTRLQKHFEQSVLSKLPERYNSHSKQSVISEEDDMVAEPKLDSFVICGTRKFLGALPVDDRQVILCLLLIL